MHVINPTPERRSTEVKMLPPTPDGNQLTTRLRETQPSDPYRRHTIARHELVIGPLCDSEVFGQKVRLFHCLRCRSSFQVCGSKVAVVDKGGNSSTGGASSRRSGNFEEGLCPVLEAFASESLAEVAVTGGRFPGKSAQPSTTPPKDISST